MTDFLKLRKLMKTYTTKYTYFLEQLEKEGVKLLPSGLFSFLNLPNLIASWKDKEGDTVFVNDFIMFNFGNKNRIGRVLAIIETPNRYYAFVVKEVDPKTYLSKDKYFYVLSNNAELYKVPAETKELSLEKARFLKIKSKIASIYKRISYEIQVLQGEAPGQLHNIYLHIHNYISQLKTTLEAFFNVDLESLFNEIDALEQKLKEAIIKFDKQEVQRIFNDLKSLVDNFVNQQEQSLFPNISKTSSLFICGKGIVDTVLDYITLAKEENVDVVSASWIRDAIEQMDMSNTEKIKLIDEVIKLFGRFNINIANKEELEQYRKKLWGITE